VRSFDKAFKRLFEDTFILYESIKMFLSALVDEYGVTQDSIESRIQNFSQLTLKQSLPMYLLMLKRKN